jgi:quinol monooxygenase YgiN
MYVVIRKFDQMRSVREAARRAQTGIGELLRQSPGFRGYYVFDAGNGVGGSVTLFEDHDSASAANEKAMVWIRASLADLVQGEPEITQGEVVAMVTLKERDS